MPLDSVPVVPLVYCACTVNACFTTAPLVLVMAACSGEMVMALSCGWLPMRFPPSPASPLPTGDPSTEPPSGLSV